MRILGLPQRFFDFIVLSALLIQYYKRGQGIRFIAGCQFIKGGDEPLVISGERHGQRIRKQGCGGLIRRGMDIKHNPMRIFFFVIKNCGRYSVQPFLGKNIAFERLSATFPTVQTAIQIRCFETGFV